MRISLRNTVLGLAGAAVVGAFLGTASAYAMGDASGFRHERNAGLTQIQASDSGKDPAAPVYQSAETSFSDTAIEFGSDRHGSNGRLPGNHVGGR